MMGGWLGTVYSAEEYLNDSRTIKVDKLLV